MRNIRNFIARGIVALVIERRSPGRNLKYRANNILALLDGPGTSTGPIDATNSGVEDPCKSKRQVCNLKTTVLLEGCSEPADSDNTCARKAMSRDLALSTTETCAK